MNPAIAVFRKEFREMMRDKRVRSAAIFGPIMLIVLMISLFGFVFSTVGKKENQKIHIVKTNSPLKALFEKAKFQVIEVDSVAKGEELVKSGKARLVLNIGNPTPEGQIPVDAYVDPKNQTGEIAFTVVRAVIGETNKAALSAVLRKKNIPEAVEEGIKLKRNDVQVGEKGGASEFLVSLLPYFIVMWAFYGAMSIASDLVAGEKEKNTLETLLISPVRRTEIVLGKFLALSSISLISSLSCLVGMALVSVLKLPGTEMMFKNGLGLSPVAALVIVAVMLPLVALFSSILIAVSSYARNPREAQTYLTQVSFVVILPAIFSQFIGLMDAGSAFWVNFIPILNSANNIRLALLGKAEVSAVLATIAVSLVLALIALRITVRFFNREEVLVRI